MVPDDSWAEKEVPIIVQPREDEIPSAANRSGPLVSDVPEPKFTVAVDVPAPEIDTPLNGPDSVNRAEPLATS